MRVLIRLNLKPGSHEKGLNEIPTLGCVVILRYSNSGKKGKLNLTDLSDVLLSLYGLKNIWNCQIKHIGLWPSLLFMALKQRDKVFCGNRSNVKPDSRTSTSMATLLLALGRWIVKATHFFQMLDTFFQNMKIGCERSRFCSSLQKQRLWLLFCRDNNKANRDTWTQQKLSPSVWLWRDGHLSPSASTRLRCSFTHYVNKDFMRGHSSYSAT